MMFKAMSVDKSHHSPLSNSGSSGTVTGSPVTRSVTDVTSVGSTVPLSTPIDRRPGDTSPSKSTNSTGEVNPREGSIMDSLTGELNNYAQTASNTLSDFFGMYIAKYFCLQRVLSSIDSFEDVYTNLKCVTYTELV